MEICVLTKTFQVLNIISRKWRPLFCTHRLISRYGDIHWPAQSPDLSSCDYFLWGYLKSKVFEARPATIKELKERIHAEIHAITPAVLRRVSENFHTRLTQCVQNNGRHFPDIIFKTWNFFVSTQISTYVLFDYAINL